MRRIPTIPILAALSTLIFVAWMGAAPGARGDAAAAEVARIRTHLERVEQELRARDVSHLTPAQRANRARHLDVLAEYHRTGVFPHNHDFPGERRPYFVDAHGTLCAMAYLIARSGHEEMVRRVARAANNAYVRELSGDPELLAWLDEAGLTADEAARIQPQYGGFPIPEEEEEERVGRGEALTALSAAALSSLSIGINLAGTDRGGSPWPGILGLATGAGSAVVGIDQLGRGGAHTGMGAATTVLGAAAMGLGARTLLSRGDAAAGAPASTLTVAPILDARGAGVWMSLGL